MNTGGPAFPVLIDRRHDPNFDYETGMTLRDYFAAKAFQTRLAKHSDWTLDELTKQAFYDADAMLKAREQ